MLCVFALGFQQNTVLPSVASFNPECRVACVLTQHLIFMIMLREVCLFFSDSKKSENRKSEGKKRVHGKFLPWNVDENELPNSSSNPRPIECIEWMKNLHRCRSVIGYSWENQSNLLCWALGAIHKLAYNHFDGNAATFSCVLVKWQNSQITSTRSSRYAAHQQFFCERKRLIENKQQKIVAPLGIATQINWAYSIPIENRLNIWRRNNENLI